MRTNNTVGIYCIENLVNLKKYFGQSLSIESRLSTHRLRLRKGIHRNEHLQSSWNKYGEKNFKFKVVCVCNPEDLDKRESEFIGKFQTNNKKHGYNLDSGGTSGKTKSLSTKIKMSVAKLGKKFSDEHRKNISLSNLGRKMHDNTRQALLNAISNPSDETKRKWKESRKNRVWKEESRSKLSSSLKSSEKYKASVVHKHFDNQGISCKKNKPSKYVGVIKYKDKWVARIGFLGRRIYLGTFGDEICAAQAYDRKAVELYGKDAKTNL